MVEYNQKLNQISHQYRHVNVSAPGAYYSNKPKSENMTCHEIKRNVYIFKTTIEIVRNL